MNDMSHAIDKHRAPCSMPVQSRRHWLWLAKWVDTLSCVAFCFSATITINFYSLHIATGGMVERSEDRPPWLGFTVHAMNSILAWLDIIVSRPRSFTMQARYASVGLSLCYLCFICTCRCALGRHDG
jgi:hypothetical protein